MVTILDYKTFEKENGENFYGLIVQGGIEAVKSLQTGKTYFTAKTVTVPTTFNKQTCESLVGSKIDGVVKKVGLKAVQRNDLDYEFTLVFDVDIKHFAVSSKDRTGLFFGKPEFIINSNTGRKILDWCNSGTNLQDAREKIIATKTVDELKVLYNQYSSWRELLEYDFKLQKDTINTKELLLNPKSFSTNGHTHP